MTQVVARSATPTATHPNGKPRWTREQAVAAGKRSAEVRKARAAEQAELRARYDAALEAFQGADIGPATLHAVAMLVQASVSGNIPVPENALERKRLAETAEILHRIARLELGESTANTVTLTGDLADLDARRAELLSRLQAHQVVDATTSE
jgi:hypothetical protein